MEIFVLLLGKGGERKLQLLILRACGTDQRYHQPQIPSKPQLQLKKMCQKAYTDSVCNLIKGLVKFSFPMWEPVRIGTCLEDQLI